MIEQTRSKQAQTRTRAGSLVIECVIASVILASCSIALLKWTQSANQLKRQANTHTAAVLIADNAKQRLKQATVANAAETAQNVASNVSRDQGLEVSITHSEFDNPSDPDSDLRGVHFKITVSHDNSPVTVAHCWNLVTPDRPPSNGEASAGTTSQATEQDGGTANDNQ